MVHLLAYDGNAENQRQGKLGKLLHDFSKWAIRESVEKIWTKMKPVIEYKIKTGWINPEIGKLYEDLTYVINFYEDDKYGFKGPDDKNRKFFHHLRDILCVQLDEDTHYLLFVGMVMQRMFEQKEEYEALMNRSNAFFRWREIYNGLKERTAELPTLEEAYPGLFEQVEKMKEES